MINDQYVTAPPNHQHAIDLFAGEWSTDLRSRGLNTGAENDLTHDPRIEWALQVLAAHVPDEIDRVLELGPLEGAHTYMLAGAFADVTAVEANTRCYLRCLVVKEILGTEAKFFLGDFREYLQHGPAFDAVFGLGVLYHAEDPPALLRAMAEAAEYVVVWTHYWAPDHPRNEDFVAEQRDGYVAHVHTYRDNGEARFCGGPNSTSVWLSREDLMLSIDKAGLDILDIGFEVTTPNGPEIMFVARRR